MDGVYEWLRDIAVFFLLMTAVLNILPEAKYRKYVQFFLGLVMLAVLCRPILALGNLEGALGDALEKMTLEAEAQDLKNSQIRIEGLQQEVLYGAYERELQDQISAFLEGQGLEPVRVEVSIGEDREGELQIRRMEITARKDTGEHPAEDSGENDAGSAGGARELKKELAEAYQVSEAHIIIRLQE